MKPCSGHLHDMGNAVKRRGLFRYVDAANAKGFSARFLLGTAKKDELDPLVILMLEVTAKAVRMGLRQDSERCPLCAIAYISKDNETPGRVIEGLMQDVIVPLLRTNGRRAA